MSIENKNISVPERQDWQWTPLARKLGATAAGFALSAGAALGITHAAESPEMNGNVVKIAQPGDTLWDMTDEIPGVDAGNHREVIHQVEKNSADLDDNSLDVGDKVNLPTSIE